MPMKNEELLEKIGEIIDKKLEQSQKDIFWFPFSYPYSYTSPAVMAASAPTPAQTQQEVTQPKTEELNEAALSFMDGFMGS